MSGLLILISDGARLTPAGVADGMGIGSCRLGAISPVSWAMSTDAIDPISALESLGLPNYEARVFVALQKLGTGTAKEIGEIADVPRSQVYGTAEALEDRGLIQIQQSTPKTYRPVPLEEARERLEERFQENSDRAFSYLEQVKDDHAETAEKQEGVWRLDGTAAIESRTCQLIDAAEERVVFGLNEQVAFSAAVKEHLEAKAADGIPVLVLTDDVERLPPLDEVHIQVIPPNLQGSGQAGRLLIVDSDTVLMSVLEDDGTETAIWSARTGMARVLVPLVEDATLRTDEPA